MVSIWDNDKDKVWMSYFAGTSLPIQSYIKYDKYFIINSEIVDKTLAVVNKNLLEKLKILFCQELF